MKEGALAFLLLSHSHSSSSSSLSQHRASSAEQLIQVQQPTVGFSHLSEQLISQLAPPPPSPPQLAPVVNQLVTHLSPLLCLVSISQSTYMCPHTHTHSHNFHCTITHTQANCTRASAADSVAQSPINSHPLFLSIFHTNTLADNTLHTVQHSLKHMLIYLFPFFFFQTHSLSLSLQLCRLLPETLWPLTHTHSSASLNYLARKATNTHRQTS